MKFSLVLAALLCFTTWMSMVHATHAPVSTCCIQWSNTKIPLKRVRDYAIQTEGRCPIKAIIIHTTVGKRLCSDPDGDWTKKAILKVDEEKKKKALQEKGQNDDGSTSDITPAVSTTSKKVTQKRRRKGGRRQRKNFRRRKNGQKRCCV